MGKRLTAFSCLCRVAVHHGQNTAVGRKAHCQFAGPALPFAGEVGANDKSVTFAFDPVDRADAFVEDQPVAVDVECQIVRSVTAAGVYPRPLPPQAQGDEAVTVLRIRLLLRDVGIALGRCDPIGGRGHVIGIRHALVDDVGDDAGTAVSLLIIFLAIAGGEDGEQR